MPEKPHAPASLPLPSLPATLFGELDHGDTAPPPHAAPAAANGHGHGHAEAAAVVATPPLATPPLATPPLATPPMSPWSPFDEELFALEARLVARRAGRQLLSAWLFWRRAGREWRRSTPGR